MAEVKFCGDEATTLGDEATTLGGRQRKLSNVADAVGITPTSEAGNGATREGDTCCAAAAACYIEPTTCLMLSCITTGRKGAL